MTIIDYASPRPRSKLRLPSKSRIVCQYEADRLTVVETLEMKGEAIGGIAFAVFMLIYLGAIIVWARYWSESLVVGAFWLAEAGVMLLVIHQTWRRTILIATPMRLELKFTSQLHRKQFGWDSSTVGGIVGFGTANLGYEPLAELRIALLSGRDVRLFTDHRAEQIEDLAVALRRTLAGHE